MLAPPGFTAIAGEAFWSPDSKWVAFPSAFEVRKVHVPDGSAEVMARLPGFNRGGAWAQDGTILITSTVGATWSLYVLGHDAASFQRLTVPGLSEGAYFHPEFLPGSLDFLFAFRPESSSDCEIYLATLDGSRVTNPVRLMTNETAVHFTPVNGGRILFVRNDRLYSQKLNLGQRRLIDSPEAVQTDVASAPAYGLADFSVSRAGLVAWRPGKRSSSQIVEFDRKGNRVATSGPPSEFTYLRLSPDETHLLGNSLSGMQLIERGRSASLALGPFRFMWSPDGSALLGQQASKIVARAVNGSGEVRTLADVPNILYAEDISPDGKVALYTTNDLGKTSVYSIRLDGTETDGKVVVSPGERIIVPRFSPDGRWIVYSARSAQNQNLGIFVQPFPGPGLRRQITSTGIYPVWRKDGREIVFVDGNPQQISSVSLGVSGKELRLDPPVRLFVYPSVLNALVGMNPLEVSRDGSRIFLPATTEQPEDSNVIHVKTLW